MMVSGEQLRNEFRSNTGWGDQSVGVAAKVGRLARKYNLPFKAVDLFIEGKLKTNLHLTEEDATVKGQAPAIQASRNRQRYERKERERFHRTIVATKARRKADRAKRHGWKPKDGVRYLGTHSS